MTGSKPMTVLVLGVSGMLGSAVFRVLGSETPISVKGTLRSAEALVHFSEAERENIITGVDVESTDSLLSLMATLRPSAVINCIGLVKQLSSSKDPLLALPINSILPHRLARMCSVAGARLIHISTDCVFSGKAGNYREEDTADADDLYGRTKLIGEVDYPHAVTLRTSIIGHELTGNRSLLSWFLSQKGAVPGFTRAVFSGLTTIELARVIERVVLPDATLHGLYHVAAKPIDKFSLLKLIAEVYQKPTEITPNGSLVIDRSLNAERFKTATGYVAPEWPDMISAMRERHMRGVKNAR